VSRALIIFAHALVGWAMCFAVIGTSMAITSVQMALIAHAIAAPVIFCGVSLVYFSRFGYTTPLQTAIAFTGLVILLDFFVSALIVLHSLYMFASALGTWIPFGLIFASTWLTGSVHAITVRGATRQAPAT
jgi:hypothetical protein